MASPHGDEYQQLPLPRRTRSLDASQAELLFQDGGQGNQGNYGQYNTVPNMAPETATRSIRPHGIPPLPPSPQSNSYRGKQGYGMAIKEEDQYGGQVNPPRNRPNVPQYQRAGFQSEEVGWGSPGPGGFKAPGGISSSLARTTSAPPLGSPLLKMNDFGEYRTISEASTPDQSPSYPTFAFNSPEKERRMPAGGGLQKTKLSRTSSCPPLGEVDEGEEYLENDSEGGEDGSGGDDNSSVRNKRKRLLAAAAGGSMAISPSNSNRKSDEWERQKREDSQSGGSMSMSVSEGGGNNNNSRGGMGGGGGGGPNSGGAAVTSAKSFSGGGERERGERGERAGKSAKDREKAKAYEESPKDYIHVRARRGQATDSHSLAERVRRERISERMKVLQDLVPTCSKVSGKAMMLDEIINYVRSLQMQVELLSSKLAAIDNESHSRAANSNSEGAYNNGHVNPLDQGGSSSQVSLLHQLQLHQQNPNLPLNPNLADISSLLNSGSAEDVNTLASLGLLQNPNNSTHSHSRTLSHGGQSDLSGLNLGGNQGHILRTSGSMGSNNLGEALSDYENSISDARLQELLAGSTVGMRSLALSQLQGSGDLGNQVSSVGNPWSGTNGFMK